MSGFPSLNDLINPKSAGVGDDDSVQEKFQKKMQSVATREEEVEAMRLAAALDLPHIDLTRFPVGREALRQITKDRALELGVVCFYFAQDELRLGTVDPEKEGVDDVLFELEERNQAKGGIYVISPKSFEHVIKLYDTLPTIKPITKDIEIKPEELEEVESSVSDFSSLQKILSGANTTRKVAAVLGASLKLGASDVHIEAEAERIMVRFRLDGILHDAAILPKDDYRQLVSRIKLVSSLKINITDKPQDGRFTIKLKEGDVDVRVSTIPTVYGESIVMRLLRQSRGGLTLENIGLVGGAYPRLKREIERPNGMIITTGPTGSGKTTTLYSIMQILNEPGVKIITLEDPVEYRIAGVNQSQIDRSRDYTFAKGLRSMLRQDPDIAMVGEIRDLETADIAIQAALTGHLMLSTIHTNSAAGAIPRFLSMGVKPFLLAPALNCVIGQRLVRRVCQACKISAPLVPEIAAKVAEVVQSMSTDRRAEIEGKLDSFVVGQGCEACHGIGYKGRMGIYEVMTMSEKIEQLILSGAVSEYEIERAAIEGGMVRMVEDGLIKAIAGETTVEEVFRVIE